MFPSSADLTLFPCHSCCTLSDLRLLSSSLWGHHYYLLIILSLHLVSLSRYSSSKVVSDIKIFPYPLAHGQFASSQTKYWLICYVEPCFSLWYFIFPLLLLYYGNTAEWEMLESPVGGKPLFLTDTYADPIEYMYGHHIICPLCFTIELGPLFSLSSSLPPLKLDLRSTSL